MSKNKELVFMGQTAVVSPSGKIKVSKAGHNAIMDDLGVTKDMRKTLAAAEDTLIKEAITFTGNQVCQTKKESILEVGTGATKIKFTMSGEKDVRAPGKDGGTTTKYGQLSIRKRGVISTALRSNELADMQAAIETAFK